MPVTDTLKPALILYATREGQARRVADYLATNLVDRGRTAEVVDAALLPIGFRLTNYSLAILVASVHGGHHESEMRQFVRQHSRELAEMPAAFLSISLSEAGAEDPHASPEARERAAADVDRMIQSFLDETGWHPESVQPVAGALRYSKYNFVLRFIMKRIAAKAGASTDTSQDYEFTDWAALNVFLDDFLTQTAPHTATAG